MIRRPPRYTRTDTLFPYPTLFRSFHPDHGEGLCVAALPVQCAGEDGKAKAAAQRDCEAEAVAEMCSRLIGSQIIVDRKTDERRPCRPGDIALLAPGGTELWRYEEELATRRVPVATQAGTGRPEQRRVGRARVARGESRLCPCQ